MTAEAKINARMESLLRSISSNELNRIYCRIRNSKDVQVELQKQLLALSFGCHASGKPEAAQSLYDAAGFIAGFGVKAEEDYVRETP